MVGEKQLIFLFQLAQFSIKIWHSFGLTNTIEFYFLFLKIRKFIFETKMDYRAVPVVEVIGWISVEIYIMRPL